MWLYFLERSEHRTQFDNVMDIQKVWLVIDEDALPGILCATRVFNVVALQKYTLWMFYCHLLYIFAFSFINTPHLLLTLQVCFGKLLHHPSLYQIHRLYMHVPLFFFPFVEIVQTT